MTNSADPDQLTSSEANWSGSIYTLKNITPTSKKFSENWLLHVIIFLTVSALPSNWFMQKNFWWRQFKIYKYISNVRRSFIPTDKNYNQW